MKKIKVRIDIKREHSIARLLLNRTSSGGHQPTTSISIERALLRVAEDKFVTDLLHEVFWNSVRLLIQRI